MIIFIIDLSAENFHLLSINQRAIAEYKTEYKTNYNGSSNFIVYRKWTIVCCLIYWHYLWCSFCIKNLQRKGFSPHTVQSSYTEIYFFSYTQIYLLLALILDINPLFSTDQICDNMINCLSSLLLSLHICPRVTETEKSYRMKTDRWRDSKLKFTSSLYLSESLHRLRQEEHNDIGGSYNGAINMCRSFTWEEEVLSFRCGYLCLASLSLQSQLLQLLQDVFLTVGGQTQNKFKHNSHRQADHLHIVHLKFIQLTVWLLQLSLTVVEKTLHDN